MAIMAHQSHANDEVQAGSAAESSCPELFTFHDPEGVEDILARSQQRMTRDGHFPTFDFTSPEGVAEANANLLERKQSPYVGLYLIGHRISYDHAGFTYTARVTDLSWEESGRAVLTLRLIGKKQAESGNERVMTESMVVTTAVLEPGDYYTYPLGSISDVSYIPKLYVEDALFFLQQDEDLKPNERRRIPLSDTDEESRNIAFQRVDIARQITRNATEMSIEEASNNHQRLRFINHLNRGEWGWIESRLKSSIGYPWSLVNRIRQAKYKLAQSKSGKQKDEVQGALDALLVTLATRLDKYLVHYDLVREILADPSYSEQQKTKLGEILEAMAYEFHSIPPTHQELLYHASDIKVEMARLEHYKKLEEQLFKRRIGAYLLNVINMQDPPKQIPENIGRFYKMFRKDAVDNFHLSVVLFKLIQVRKLATFDDAYHDYLMAGLYTRSSSEEAMEEEDEKPAPSSRRPGRPEAAPAATVETDGGAVVNAAPPENRVAEFRVLDQMLYDAVWTLAFQYENHPLVALYRVAQSDRVVNAVVTKMEMIARTRSEGAVEKMSAAKKAADELGPLPLEYSGNSLWFKMTSLKQRVGNYFTAPKIGRWLAYGALLSGGLVAKWYTGFSFQDFAVDAGAFLGAGADVIGGWLGVGLEDAGASPETIERAVDAAEKALEDGTLDECLTPDGDICPDPEQMLDTEIGAG